MLRTYGGVYMQLKLNVGIDLTLLQNLTKETSYNLGRREHQIFWHEIIYRKFNPWLI